MNGWVWVAECDDRYYDSGSDWVFGVFATPEAAMISVDEWVEDTVDLFDNSPAYHPHSKGHPVWTATEDGLSFWASFFGVRIHEDLSVSVTLTEVQS